MPMMKTAKTTMNSMGMGRVLLGRGNAGDARRLSDGTYAVERRAVSALTGCGPPLGARRTRTHRELR
jgi:hypothetical protein